MQDRCCDRLMEHGLYVGLVGCDVAGEQRRVRPGRERERIQVQEHCEGAERERQPVSRERALGDEVRPGLIPL